MGTLRSELLRVVCSPPVKVSEAEAKAMWEEHVEAHHLLEEKAWELALAERLHGHRRRPDEGKQKCSQYHDGRERRRWSIATVCDLDATAICNVCATVRSLTCESVSKSI